MKSINQILFACLAVVLFNFKSYSQDPNTYQLPPKDIADMFLAKPTPAVSVDEKGEWMILMQSAGYPSVEELARPELKLAGLRLNPTNFAPSRQIYFNELTLRNINSNQDYKIIGLPTTLSAGNVTWSPDYKKIAFTQTTTHRVDLYVIDVATKRASKINRSPLNTIEETYKWYDEKSLLYLVATQSSSAAPVKTAVPSGPTMQENFGKASPRPTFQDMIKSPYDEKLFEFYMTTQLVKNTNGVELKINNPMMYYAIDVSPDKQYLLTRTLKKTFSYLVPVNGFPADITILDAKGNKIKALADLPSSETSPSGNDNVQTYPRFFNWRNDEAATVTWCQALDSGYIKTAVDYHDAVYALSAPFNSEPKELFKTKMRYRGASWGNSTTALVYEGLSGKQIIQTNTYNPSTGQLEKLSERNTTDAYSNPGTPVTAKNQYGAEVLKFINGGTQLLMNNVTGSSSKGDLPFLATLDLQTKKTNIIWRCAENTFEYVTKVLDADQFKILTRKETQTEVPNYWIKNLKLKIADRPLTKFTNPYPQLAGIEKEKIKYTRADGVTLTGELYLPKGYDKTIHGKLPTLLWAYPAEYNSAADAAQVRGSEHKYTMLNWGSPVYYVTQGYAVLNNAEMPIVAVNADKKPNDNFIDQLRMNAEAAINALDSMGVGDRHRMSVGGHSYGAFMTANLLAHTNLFRAGIARSGAYNRSLTPFGFQNEDRTYWQAPEIYRDMSPFSFADKIKTPILLVHGEMDNNTGTYPIQSERMFNAIKGHGGTVKYLSLPYESHGYQGRENILHLLNEQFQWLEKYVKPVVVGGVKKA